MTKWYSAKEAPNYEEWILTEWYDGDDGGIKYEADYLYSFVYWKDYVRRNNNIFSHTDKTDEYLDYVCVNGRWEFCIPYEGNESLLGTTKDVEVSYGRSF